MVESFLNRWSKLFFVFFYIFWVHFRKQSRITSYNVCYTKLLRPLLLIIFLSRVRDGMLSSLVIVQTTLSFGPIVTDEVFASNAVAPVHDHADAV